MYTILNIQYTYAARANNSATILHRTVPSISEYGRAKPVNAGEIYIKAYSVKCSLSICYIFIKNSIRWIKVHR